MSFELNYQLQRMGVVKHWSSVTESPHRAFAGNMIDVYDRFHIVEQGPQELEAIMHREEASTGASMDIDWSGMRLCDLEVAWTASHDETQNVDAYFAKRWPLEERYDEILTFLESGPIWPPHGDHRRRIDRILSCFMARLSPECFMAVLSQFAFVFADADWPFGSVCLQNTYRGERHIVIVLAEILSWDDSAIIGCIASETAALLSGQSRCADECDEAERLAQKLRDWGFGEEYVAMKTRLNSRARKTGDTIQPD